MPRVRELLFSIFTKTGNSIFERFEGTDKEIKFELSSIFMDDLNSGKTNVAVSESTNNSQTETDFFWSLVQRVRAGQPIHVSGQLDEVQGRLHLATINRIREETNLPIHVIHS